MRIQLDQAAGVLVVPGSAELMTAMAMSAEDHQPRDPPDQVGNPIRMGSWCRKQDDDGRHRERGD
jgi:hypothetical protein